MLGSKQRIPRKMFGLLKKPDFLGSNQLFLIRIVSNNTLKTARFSVSVSKKVEKDAVRRNKMRRIGYLFLQKKIKHINKPVLAQISYKLKNTNKIEIFSNLEDILKRANLI